jgi:hypothetical protein
MTFAIICIFGGLGFLFFSVIDGDKDGLRFGAIILFLGIFLGVLFVEDVKPSKEEEPIKIAKRVKEKKNNEITSKQYETLSKLFVNCPNTRKGIFKYSTTGILSNNYQGIVDSCEKESINETRRKVFFDALSKE